MLTAIRCGKLIDGTGAPAIDDGVILIEDNRIADIGSSHLVTVPEAAEVIDLSELTLLPGLIDMHAHLGFDISRGDTAAQMREPFDSLVKNSELNCRRMLKHGITTAREMGHKDFIDRLVKEAVESGQVPGPRLLTSTRGLRSSRGHGAVATPADGIEGIRAAVRENLDHGADFLKIFVSSSALSGLPDAIQCFYTEEEIRVAVEEAHRAGKKIAAHCEGGAGLRYSLEAGLDFVEHGTYLSEEDVDLILRKGASLTVTMARIFEPPQPETNPTAVIAQESVRASFRRAREAGVPWAAGTDNRSIALELELLVDCGVSCMEALQAVGRRAAELLGMADEIGTLETGKFADLVAVEGDPLLDIRAMRRVNKVMRSGVLYDTKTL